MRGRFYDKAIKKKAEKLRSERKSYREITKLLEIPKSTLSEWLGKKYPGLFNRKAQLLHLARVRPLAIAAKKAVAIRQKAALREKVHREISAYPWRQTGFLKSILAALYWAEGAKHKGVSGLKFVNTDPKLALFYITLLRKCYKLDEAKFRIRVHLHYYHNITAARNFWSELLQIPLGQFGRIYIKKRSKTKRFRQNFKGICLISYLDSAIRKELLEIAFQLQENLSKRNDIKSP